LELLTGYALALCLLHGSDDLVEIRLLPDGGVLALELRRHLIPYVLDPRNGRIVAGAIVIKIVERLRHLTEALVFERRVMIFSGIVSPPNRLAMPPISAPMPAPMAVPMPGMIERSATEQSAAGNAAERARDLIRRAQA